MEIKTLELNNFRNYGESHLDFSSGLNVFVGANAQGKTNILEAIYFLAIGKSQRTSKEKEAIKWGAERARICLHVQKKYSKTKLEMQIAKIGKKTITINGVPIKKIGSLFGEFNAVYFSPDELKLVKDCPEDRRKFMDISLSQMSKNYFYLLSRYEKVLANRNKLLKDLISQDKIKQTISIWDEQLSIVGAKIIFQRIEFLKRLSPFAKLSHDYLTDNSENLSLEYVGMIGETEAEIYEKIKKQLVNCFDKDYRLGYTSIGPHRDDIKVKVNDIDVKAYGSQGQQRTVALSLKLAEMEILERQTGEKPVLLLDDVLSELDINRRKKLINFCKKNQTMLTCTEFEFLGKETCMFQVEQGHVKKIGIDKK